MFVLHLLENVLAIFIGILISIAILFIRIKYDKEFRERCVQLRNITTCKRLPDEKAYNQYHDRPYSGKSTKDNDNTDIPALYMNADSFKNRHKFVTPHFFNLFLFRMYHLAKDNPVFLQRIKQSMIYNLKKSSRFLNSVEIKELWMTGEVGPMIESIRIISKQEIEQKTFVNTRRLSKSIETSHHVEPTRNLKRNTPTNNQSNVALHKQHDDHKGPSYEMGHEKLFQGGNELRKKKFHTEKPNNGKINGKRIDKEKKDGKSIDTEKLKYNELNSNVSKENGEKDTNDPHTTPAKVNTPRHDILDEKEFKNALREAFDGAIPKMIEDTLNERGVFLNESDQVNFENDSADAHGSGIKSNDSSCESLKYATSNYARENDNSGEHNTHEQNLSNMLTNTDNHDGSNSSDAFCNRNHSTNSDSQQNKVFKESHNNSHKSTLFHDLLPYADLDLDHTPVYLLIHLNCAAMINMVMSHTLFLDVEVKMSVGNFHGPMVVALPLGYKMGVSFLKEMKYDLTVDTIVRMKNQNTNKEPLPNGHKNNGLLIDKEFFNKELLVNKQSPKRQGFNGTEQIKKEPPKHKMNIKKGSSLNNIIKRIVRYTSHKKGYWPNYQLRPIPQLLPRARTISIIVPDFAIGYTFVAEAKDKNDTDRQGIAGMSNHGINTDIGTTPIDNASINIGNSSRIMSADCSFLLKCVVLFRESIKNTFYMNGRAWIDLILHQLQIIHAMELKTIGKRLRCSSCTSNSGICLYRITFMMKEIIESMDYRNSILSQFKVINKKGKDNKGTNTSGKKGNISSNTGRPKISSNRTTKGNPRSNRTTKGNPRSNRTNSISYKGNTRNALSNTVSNTVSNTASNTVSNTVSNMDVVYNTGSNKGNDTENTLNTVAIDTNRVTFEQQVDCGITGIETNIHSNGPTHMEDGDTFYDCVAYDQSGPIGLSSSLDTISLYTNNETDTEMGPGSETIGEVIEDDTYKRHPRTGTEKSDMNKPFSLNSSGQYLKGIGSGDNKNRPIDDLEVERNENRAFSKECNVKGGSSTNHNTLNMTNTQTTHNEDKNEDNNEDKNKHFTGISRENIIDRLYEYFSDILFFKIFPSAQIVHKQSISNKVKVFTVVNDHLEYKWVRYIKKDISTNTLSFWLNTSTHEFFTLQILSDTPTISRISFYDSYVYLNMFINRTKPIKMIENIRDTYIEDILRINICKCDDNTSTGGIDTNNNHHINSKADSFNTNCHTNNNVHSRNDALNNKHGLERGIDSINKTGLLPNDTTSYEHTNRVNTTSDKHNHRVNTTGDKHNNRVNTTSDKHNNRVNTTSDNSNNRVNTTEHINRVNTTEHINRVNTTEHTNRESIKQPIIHLIDRLIVELYKYDQPDIKQSVVEKIKIPVDYLLPLRSIELLCKALIPTHTTINKIRINQYITQITDKEKGNMYLYECKTFSLLIKGTISNTMECINTPTPHRSTHTATSEHTANAIITNTLLLCNYSSTDPFLLHTIDIKQNIKDIILPLLSFKCITRENYSNYHRYTRSSNHQGYTRTNYHNNYQGYTNNHNNYLNTHRYMNNIDINSVDQANTYNVAYTQTHDTNPYVIKTDSYNGLKTLTYSFKSVTLLKYFISTPIPVQLRINIQFYVEGKCYSNDLLIDTSRECVIVLRTKSKVVITVQPNNKDNKKYTIRSVILSDSNLEINRALDQALREYRDNNDNHGSMGGNHGGMGGNHGSMRGNHGSIGGNHGSIGGNHGSMRGNHGSMGGNHGGMSGNHGSMGGNHGSMGGKSNNTGNKVNSNNQGNKINSTNQGNKVNSTGTITDYNHNIMFIVDAVLVLDNHKTKLFFPCDRGNRLLWDITSTDTTQATCKLSHSQVTVEIKRFGLVQCEKDIYRLEIKGKGKICGIVGVK